MTDYFRDIEVFDVKELAKLCGGNFDADKLAEESGVDFTSARVLHQRTPYESLRSKLFPDTVFKEDRGSGDELEESEDHDEILRKDHVLIRLRDPGVDFKREVLRLLGRPLNEQGPLDIAPPPTDLDAIVWRLEYLTWVLEEKLSLTLASIPLKASQVTLSLTVGSREQPPTGTFSLNEGGRIIPIGFAEIDKWAKEKSKDSGPVLPSRMDRIRKLLDRFPAGSFQIPFNTFSQTPTKEMSYRAHSCTDPSSGLPLPGRGEEDVPHPEADPLHDTKAEDDFRRFHRLKPLGIRSPEGRIWASTTEDLGHTDFLPNVFTTCSNSMLKEMFAFDQYNNPTYFDVPAFPRVLEPIPYAVQALAGGYLKKLQYMIDIEDLPDTLIVHDEEFLTGKPKKSSRDTSDSDDNDSDDENPKSQPGRTIQYRRVDARSFGAAWVPVPPKFYGSPTTAHLHLHKIAELGSGHWSKVYQAKIELDIPVYERELNANNTPRRREWTRSVRKKRLVAAKIPSIEVGYRTESNIHHRREGKIFQSFPPHLSQDYSGLQVLPRKQLKHSPVAVVPKFYGYYVTDEKNEFGTPFTPILLMEECGRSIGEGVENRPQHQRETILQLIQRLHLTGFSQQSTYTRNMVEQPGPLSLPAARRTWKTPSFRIIDFGRGSNYSRYAVYSDQDIDAMYKEFDVEEFTAQKQLGMDWECPVWMHIGSR